MTLYKNKYRIESIRLKDWDYSKPWWYYITINVREHKCLFGEIKNRIMNLNTLGGILDECWNKIPEHYENVELDYYQIMPSHLHGIIILKNDVETGHAPSLRKEDENKNPLSNIIGSFKSAVTRSIHCSGIKQFTGKLVFMTG